jgi:hypothetical protein
MRRATGEHALTRTGIAWQMFAFLGGMTAYAIHLMGGVALVPLACEVGTNIPLSALNWAVIAVAAAAAWVSWKIWRRALTEVADSPSTPARRSAFLGFTGLLMNVLAILVVLFAEVHVLVLDPCLPLTETDLGGVPAEAP